MGLRIGSRRSSSGAVHSSAAVPGQALKTIPTGTARARYKSCGKKYATAEKRFAVSGEQSSQLAGNVSSYGVSETLLGTVKNRSKGFTAFGISLSAPTAPLSV